MKIYPRENLPDFSLPLPLFQAIHIADAIDSKGEEYDVFVGLEKKYADQLRELSMDPNDEDIQNFTGDYRRFVEKTYEYWYKKNRTPFALVHKRTDKLATIAWFGPKLIGVKSEKFGINDEQKAENNWHTMSVRSYPKFRRRGLMKNFTSYAIETYRKYFPLVHLWSGTDDRNVGMVKLSEELGFRIDEANSDLSANWLVMVKR